MGDILRTAWQKESKPHEVLEHPEEAYRLKDGKLFSENLY